MDHDELRKRTNEARATAGMPLAGMPLAGMPLAGMPLGSHVNGGVMYGLGDSRLPNYPGGELCHE